MEYIQNYNPLGNLWLSALVAVLPIVTFFVCLVWLKLKGHVAGFLTLLLAVLIAIFIYKMPVMYAGSSVVYGFLIGLWPISWIIIAAIFLYKISVKSGYFDILRDSIMSITPDHRIQVVLIGFCFGAFLEGAIGFGGPVAITAALLAGLGLRPLHAAGLCMIANTAPVAFGAVGIPITAMAALTNVSALEISGMVGTMIFPLSIIIPFFLVLLMDGFKGIKETWPVVIVTALSFALTQIFFSKTFGPELPDIASAVVSIVATVVFLKFWNPKNIVRFDDLKAEDFKGNHHSFGKILLAWSPFVILIIMIVIWTLPGFKAFFGKDGALAFTNLSFKFDNLAQIFETQPVKAQNTAVKSVFSLPLIATVGTLIFLTAIISILIFRVKVTEAVGTFVETINEMKYAILTIGIVLSFAYISNYSGISASLGLALAQTGKAFAFFSPIVGWIGVFLTGSDTSSNLLFGGLQKITAGVLGVKEVIFLAANTVGGVVGKMISPQSIAVACAAVGLVGRESELFRYTVRYSIALVILIGIWVSVLAFFVFS